MYCFNNRPCNTKRYLRDWTLITGRGGGATKREGGHLKFYLYEKGGGGRRIFFSHAEGERKKFPLFIRGRARKV